MAAHALTTRSSIIDFADYLRHQRPFDTRGALHGRPGPAATLGRLPQQWHSSTRQASYVIYSYHTPIAWLDDHHQWIQPETRYSRTTSAHQSKIAAAISIL